MTNPPFYENINEYRRREMNWNEWLEKVHPVRAILALASLALTGYMLIVGIVIPDAWWIIVTALCLFYVEAVAKPLA